MSREQVVVMCLVGFFLSNFIQDNRFRQETFMSVLCIIGSYQDYLRKRQKRSSLLSFLLWDLITIWMFVLCYFLMK